MANPTWNDPIRGYFTPTDISHMKQVAGFDLGSYDDVKNNAPNIYSMVANGNMPPGNPWPQSWVENFAAWGQNGFPES